MPSKRSKYWKGIKYEQKVHAEMFRRYEARYLWGQWFAYMANTKNTVQYCQVDGLLFAEPESRIVVCEIKHSHVPDAYFQLTQEYMPILRKAFPKFELAPLEIVRWYDPATAFPVQVEMQPNPLAAAVEAFSVHILNRH